MTKKQLNEETTPQVTELVEAKTTAVAHHAPQNNFGRGLEELDVKDISLPMAMLIQKMSPLFDDPDFSGKAGMVMHSVLLEQLDTAPFVPIRYFNDRRFDLPMDDSKAAAIMGELNISEEMMHNAGKGCVCYSPDGKTGTLYGDCAKCGKGEWDGDRAPLCTKRINIVSMFDGYDFPVVVRFAKTSQKHGKKLLSAMALGGGDIFTRRYKLASVQSSDGKNTWYELTAKPMGKIAEEDYPKYEHWYKVLTTSNIIVEETEEHTEVKADESTEY